MLGALPPAFPDPMMPTDLVEQARYACQRLILRHRDMLDEAGSRIRKDPDWFWDVAFRPLSVWDQMDMKVCSDIAFAFKYAVKVSLHPTDRA